MQTPHVEPVQQRTLLLRLLDIGLVRVVGLASRAALFVFLARVLEPDQYGTVAIMLTTANLFIVALDFGLPLLLLRVGATASTDVGPAMTGIVVLRAIAVVPVAMLYIGTLRALHGPGLAYLLALAVGVYVFSVQVAQTVFAYLRGLRRTGIESTSTAVTSAAEIALSVGWYLAGIRDPLILFSALAAVRIVAAARLAVAAGGTIRQGIDWNATRSFLDRYRGALGQYFQLALAQFVISQSDTIVLQALRPTEEVGRYFACFRVAWVLFLPNDLVLAAALPRIAAAAYDAEKFRRVVVGTQRVATVWSISVIAGVLAYPSTVTAILLGSGRESMVPVLTLLVAALGFAWLPPFGLPLVLQPEPAPMVRTYVVAAAVSLSTQVALIPRLGAAGAAWASIAAYAVLKILTMRLLPARRLPAVDFAGLALPTVGALAWWTTTRLARTSSRTALSLLVLLCVGALLWRLSREASMIEEDS